MPSFPVKQASAATDRDYITYSGGLKNSLLKVQSALVYKIRIGYQITPMDFRRKSHRVREKEQPKVVIMTTLLVRVPSCPMFFAMT